MDLGACWQSGVWSAGSWVEGAWCPENVCTPESIGECWAVVWCSGLWQTGVWCPSTTTPAGNYVQRVIGRTTRAEDFIRIERIDVDALRRKREEEEIIIL
jgi:hypothetical protein